MKAVMYHYIRNPQTDLPHFRYLAVEDFKDQLNWFENNGGIATQQDFLDFLNTQKPSNKFLLTFDDGLQEHYHQVLPELIKRSAWGIFFVCSQPLADGAKLLAVHKVHYLLGYLGEHRFYDIARKHLENSEQTETIEALVPTTAYSQQQSQKKEKSLKYVFNYALQQQEADKILEEIFTELNLDSHSIAKDFYLNAEQLKTMSRSGMLIAPHSESHPLLTHCSKQESERQIINSLANLKEFQLSGYPNGFCVPYGGLQSYSEVQIQQLKNAAVVYNFIVKSKGMTEKDSLLELPRFDCNEFPHGKSTMIAAAL